MRTAGWHGTASHWHADLMAPNSEQGTQVIERPDDLTAPWLTATIGAGTVTDFAVERIDRKSVV